MSEAPDNPRMTGDDFRRWRFALGLSQVKAAARLDLSIRTMVGYENGTRPIPRTVAYACQWLWEQSPHVVRSRYERTAEKRQRQGHDDRH